MGPGSADAEKATLAAAIASGHTAESTLRQAVQVTDSALGIVRSATNGSRNPAIPPTIALIATVPALGEKTIVLLGKPLERATEYRDRM